MWRHRQVVVTAVVLALIVAGCAGRDAHPVPVLQPGDQDRSCSGIERELDFIEGEIWRLVPQTEKTTKNLALGVAGFFLVIPWFYMDLSKAEQVEIEAYRQRYNRLLNLASDKNCGFERRQIPDPRTVKQKP